MIKNDLPQRPDYAQAIFETLVRIECLLQKNCWDTQEPNKPVLSIREAADFLRISTSMMKRLIYAKKVASVKVGSRVLDIRGSLLDILVAGQFEAEPPYATNEVWEKGLWFASTSGTLATAGTDTPTGLKGKGFKRRPSDST